MNRERVAELQTGFGCCFPRARVLHGMVNWPVTPGYDLVDGHPAITAVIARRSGKHKGFQWCRPLLSRALNDDNSGAEAGSKPRFVPLVGIKSALNDDKNTLDRDTDLRRSIPVWPWSSAIFSVSDLQRRAFLVDRARHRRSDPPLIVIWGILICPLFMQRTDRETRNPSDFYTRKDRCKNG